MSAEGAVLQLTEELNRALADRYRVETEIGRGGMAVVYRAHDIRHQRSVALKVLNPELSAAIGAARFLQEIRLTANLQHPNLLPLFDSGETNGLLFYVMPLVEGESLRTRLSREKQLPIDEAIHIAACVASALDYAHARGIVHRDLKPENILLHAGEAMVADFGIAVAVTRAGGTRMTQSGVVIGTPQYMAPEQATGEREADRRSDIYALATVVYEMLAGEPPHTGGTVQALISKVLTETPVSLRIRRPSVPEHVAEAVVRGLAKIPADRWRTAREFSEALTHGHRVAAADVPVLTLRGRARGTSRFALTAVALASVILGVGIGVTVVQNSLRTSNTPRAWFDLGLPDSAPPQVVNGNSIAISENGEIIAYTSTKTPGAPPSIFVRRLSGRGVRGIPHTSGAGCVALSPDGSWVVFTAGGRLHKTRVDGEMMPVPLADSVGQCGVWTDSDGIVFESSGDLYRVRSDGREREIVTRAHKAAGFAFAIPSQVLPGGREILVHLGDTSRQHHLGIVELSNGRVTPLKVKGIAPRYASGYLLFFKDWRTIAAVPFSLDQKRVTGNEVTLQEGVSGDFDVSRKGHLAYLYWSRQGPIGAFNFVGVSTTGTVRLLSGGTNGGGANNPLDTAAFFWPRLSPDGKRVAMELRTERSVGTQASWKYDIWVYDIESRTLSRLTSNWGGVRPSGWTRDGRSVIYLAFDSAIKDIHGVRAAIRNPRVLAQVWHGSQPARELLHLRGDVFDAVVGPRDYAAYTVAVGGQFDIWLTRLDAGTTARPFVATPASEEQPRFSPDGMLLAYVSNETGRHEVYVRSVMGRSPRLQVSADGGTQPVWEPSGRRVYYRGPDHVMRATIERRPDLRVIHREALFRDSFEQRDVANYDVFPSGEELLMIRRSVEPARAAMMLNWQRFLTEFRGQ